MKNNIMTNKEKQLLLKDLFERLLYGVNVLDDLGRTYKLQLGNAYLIDLFYGNGDYVEAPIRPYLRPMSSMTEEEYAKFLDTQHWECGDGNQPKYEYTYKTFDWLNEHYFDYRNLIEKGLALPAPEGMYNKMEE